MRDSRSLTSPRSDRRMRLTTTSDLDILQVPRFERSRRLRLEAIACVAMIVVGFGLPARAAAETEVVDPFEVMAAVDLASEMKLWPGFDPTAYPVAIFDGERTLLFRHPNPPDEFKPLEGRADVWVVAGKHPAMRWNSNADIGGVRTATLLLTIEPGRPVAYEAHILYHEIFHLFSKQLHPTWMPNEMWRYSYPMEDPENYRALLLEEEALARAVDSASDEETAAWAAAALAIRADRAARLSEEHRAFETALELQEGTAVYMGRSTIGIADDMARLREDRGPEGIRWRCYETGAAIAVVLDRLMPSWKKELDAKPETTFAELLTAAVAGAEVSAASFPDEVQAEIGTRAAAGIGSLAAKRAGLSEDFNRRGKRVVIRLADPSERFEVSEFDPMAVEILAGGEALQAHLLTAGHPGGEVRLTNPHFVRRSLEGVIALTRPAGSHPFLDGFRQIEISGFPGEPRVARDGDSVMVAAEGLSVRFDRALVDSAGDEVVITVLAADGGESGEHRHQAPENQKLGT